MDIPMNYRRICIALLALLTLTSLACGSDDTVEPSSETQTYLDQIDGYDSWRILSEETPTQSASHSGHIITYINTDGSDAVDAEDYPFPEGTTLVKEVFDEPDASSPSALDIMAKTDDTEEAWYWIGATGDGQRLRTNEGSAIEGDVAMCASCHSGSDTDAVFLNEYDL